MAISMAKILTMTIKTNCVLSQTDTFLKKEDSVNPSVRKFQFEIPFTSQVDQLNVKPGRKYK